MVLNREGLGVGAIALEEAEKAAFADAQDFLEVTSGKLVVEVAGEQFAELSIVEVLVQLGHGWALRFGPILPGATRKPTAQ